jgi:hypothetical protein
MAKFILHWIPHTHLSLGRTKLAPFSRNLRSCGSAINDGIVSATCDESEICGESETCDGIRV